jgi:ubiquitin-associated SH3 domain-containing protein
MFTKFILYACPVGPLGDQISAYFKAAKAKFGWNPAHDYMPHCSLTGFFYDQPESVPIYTNLLEHILAKEQSLIPDPVMRVTGTFFHSDFHGLTLQSDWLSYIAVRFSVEAASGTRRDGIRLKEWLHLSFAYQFGPEENQGLKALARRMINPNAPVQWALRFYQHHRDKRWTCHGNWSLGGTEDQDALDIPPVRESYLVFQ